MFGLSLEALLKEILNTNREIASYLKPVAVAGREPHPTVAEIAKRFDEKAKPATKLRDTVAALYNHTDSPTMIAEIKKVVDAVASGEPPQPKITREQVKRIMQHSGLSVTDERVLHAVDNIMELLNGR